MFDFHSQYLNIKFKNPLIDEQRSIVLQKFIQSQELFPTKNNRLMRLLFENWLSQFFIKIINQEKSERSVLNFFERRAKKDISWKVKMLLPFTSFLFFKKGLLPGSPNQISYIVGLKSWLLKLKLLKIAVILNSEKKEQFYNSLSSVISEDLQKKLRDSCPDIFFCKERKLSGIPSEFIGSCIAITEDPWIKILTSNKEVCITGIAHGGLYGQLKTNYFETFEVLCSAKFYGWGFNRFNIKQNRFRESILESRMINQIYFLDRSRSLDSLSKYYLPEYIDICLNNDLKHNDWLNRLSLKHNIIKLGDPDLNSTDKRLSCISEQSRKCGIFLMDCTGHTFLYQAIYSGYPFIFFISRDSLSIINEKFLKFLFFLRDQELLYFFDEEIKLSGVLNSYLSGKIYKLEKFEEAKEYLQKNLDP